MNPTQPLTEAEKQLVEAFTPFAMNYAARHFGDDPEVLSAAGWSLMKIAARLGSHPNPRKCIAATITRECIDLKRGQAGYEFRGGPWWDRLAMPVVDDEYDPDPEAVESRLRAKIAAAINTLPWGRTIAAKYFLDRTPIRVIAEQLRADQVRLTRELEQLRILLCDRLELCA